MPSVSAAAVGADVAGAVLVAVLVNGSAPSCAVSSVTAVLVAVLGFGSAPACVGAGGRGTGPAVPTAVLVAVFTAAWPLLAESDRLDVLAVAACANARVSSGGREAAGAGMAKAPRG